MICLPRSKLLTEHVWEALLQTTAATTTATTAITRKTTAAAAVGISDVRT